MRVAAHMFPICLYYGSKFSIHMYGNTAITIVERNTGKYHEFIAKYCYECEAQVTILRH